MSSPLSIWRHANMQYKSKHIVMA